MGPTNYWAQTHRSWEMSPRLKQNVLNLHCIALLVGISPRFTFNNHLMRHWWLGRGLNTTERLRGRGRREPGPGPSWPGPGHRYTSTDTASLSLATWAFFLHFLLLVNHWYTYYKVFGWSTSRSKYVSQIPTSLWVKYPHPCFWGGNPLHASITFKNFM